MYERGPYAKGRERREAILKTTLEVFSHRGSRGASLRAIARELEISPNLLQHYFSTREELLVEVVSAWDAENDRLAEGMNFLSHWLLAIKHNTTIPGLIRLYTALAVETADLNHSARSFIAQRYEIITHKVADDIDRLKRLGLCPPDSDTVRVTRLLIAACEGLQLRSLHTSDFDMYDEFLFLLREFHVLPPAEEVTFAVMRFSEHTKAQSAHTLSSHISTATADNQQE
ncbi:MAG: hypothetical protein B5766_09435 [Candidatus Lumbricidophila eiseniae]|uniref:HTH tetR-type domain-containing protein n=1 Tax=Candidatus Lumbricidiphila eiseniae TaxID=1969409 RepID=A0A2A6FPJ1_9MICO|nr:MAG: hypothetical protein B5766_09435 [Candidatus Lumbricidophila eiseniae]